MLTATSPSLPECSRATRINSRCALCRAPIVGTSTLGFERCRDWASAIMVTICTQRLSLNRLAHANFRLQLKEKDKQAGDHQRKHPEHVDVEPSVAQDADPESFVNQDCDEAGCQKIAQSMDCN